ncbi:hypothetical protein JVU11DRAFT_3415 [Chiua virens]|nr:hypothetical protein JVU11DRAFT_3415 [Chiua virens]
MASTNHISIPGRRRAWSTSCSSTTSQSSITSIYPSVNQGSQLAEPTEGLANVYGSFTTTIPAALWLRTHLSLDIPLSGKGRAMQPDRDCGYSPPDSPLSLFQPFSRSRRSPSISRTLLTDFDWGRPSGPVSSPVIENDDNPANLHPVLKALEKGSKLSCRSICSACMKAGTNFPRCPRCDATWCSRECRLQGGKKHVCPSRL